MMHLPRIALTFAMNCVSTTMLTCALPAQAQTAAVTIYGEPITEDDIEQRAKLNFLVTYRQSARQDVINELADDKRIIKEAERNGIVLTSADVDRFYVAMCSRKGITPAQLTKYLEAHGIRPDTLKNRMKADSARATLARLRYYKYQDRLTR